MTQGGVWGGMCPPEKLELFENVVLNEAIWCTIFKYKQQAAGVSFTMLTFTLEQNDQKSGGAMLPPVWKVEGPLAPLPPVPLPMQDPLAKPL